MLEQPCHGPRLHTAKHITERNDIKGKKKAGSFDKSTASLYGESSTFAYQNLWEMVPVDVVTHPLKNTGDELRQSPCI